MSHPEINEEEGESFEDAAIQLLEQVAENTNRTADALEKLVEGIAELSEKLEGLVE